MVPRGPNTWNELLGSSRRRTPGSLGKVQARLWFAVQAAELGLRKSMAAEDAEEARKWCHCLGALANTYCKVSEGGELSQKLDAVLALKNTAMSNGHVAAPVLFNDDED